LIFQIENKNIHASDAGQGIDTKKQTLVFLHGSGLSHIVWSLTEQFFSNKNFNVLSIDLPGHGNSDGPCLDSIEKIADWLEKVFVKLNLKKEDTFKFCKSLKYFSLAESLGGVESLICHPATMTHAFVDDETKNLLGIDDALVRLSIGCEETNDLISDILFGLNKF